MVRDRGRREGTDGVTSSKHREQSAQEKSGSCKLEKVTGIHTRMLVHNLQEQLTQSMGG